MRIGNLTQQASFRSGVAIPVSHREPSSARIGNRVWHLGIMTSATEEAHMPAIIIPVLWVGGAAILLGGGWYVIGHMVH
jgi:hypothetical protein